MQESWIQDQEDKTLVPFAPVQAAMLRDSQAVEGCHVEQVVMDFTAELDAERVADAWRETVRRTEALRMRLLCGDGFPTGWEKSAEIREVEIYQELPLSWEAWLEEDRMRQIPNAGGVPWRVGIWPERMRMVWTFHHALLDGRSIAAVLRGFLGLLMHGAPPPLLRWPDWHEPTVEEIEAAAGFHEAEHAGLEQVDLPDGETGRAVECLGEVLAERLELLAGERGSSAPVWLTVAWARALALATGSDRIALGQVRAGRRDATAAGFSMNTVPVVIARDERDFAAVRAKWRETHGFDHVAPEHLPQRVFRSTGAPWTSVIMTEHGTLRQMVGEVARDGRLENLTLHESGGGGGLLASAWVRPDLRMEVEGPAAAMLAPLWRDVLLQWIENPDGLPTDLPEPMAATLAGWGDGGKPCRSEQHLANAWRESWRRHADETAIQSPHESLSYAELAARVTGLANALRRAGVQAGSAVAVLVGDRRFLAQALLAVAEAGGIYLPMDSILPEARLKAMLECARPSLLLTDMADGAEVFGLPVMTVDEVADGEIPDGPRSPADTMALLFTSGSTGKPKGVMLDHQGVLLEVGEVGRMLGLGPGDRLLQFASPGFDASLEEILSTLLSGAALVPRPLDLTESFGIFHNYVAGQGATVLDLTTAYWAAWCFWMREEGGQVPACVRAVIVGGERLSAAALAAWRECGGGSRPLWNLYGPTETSIAATAHLIQGDWRDDGDPPIGRPLPGFQVKVVDGAGRLMPPGMAGELWIGGRGVGPGYWNERDLTDRAFVCDGITRWYRTGDKVRWNDGGSLCFLGRLDDQIKIRGQRIEPDEVVRVLESHPLVEAAHVAATGTEGNLHLAAWVRWQGAADGDWVGDLTNHARAGLPSAAVPTRWAVVEDFILTERGKIDRRALPEPSAFHAGGASGGALAGPGEQRLALMWRELLEIDDIGRDDSFFDLGGNSLMALRLFARISREWGIALPVSTLLHAPTLALLAVELGKHGESEVSGPQVIPVKGGGGLPPFFCVHGGDGGVIFYRSLVGHLPEDRPLLAIESPDLGGHGEVVPVPVEQTAEDYIRVMRARQPQGPYHLGGYSYGGVVAYEMARQLIGSGQEVALLVLFDTVNPAAPTREYSMMERAEICWNSQMDSHWFSRSRGLLGRFINGTITHLQFRLEKSRALAAGITEPHDKLRALQVREAHWQSMEAYQPGVLAGRVALFKSAAVDDKFEIPDDYGWAEIVDDLEIHEVPGRHLTMFDPENVGPMARELNRLLTRAGSE